MFSWSQNPIIEVFLDKVNVHHDIVNVYVNTVNVSHDIVYMPMEMEMSPMTC